MSFESLLRECRPLAGWSRYSDYYEGEHHVDQLGVSLPPQVRILEMVANWPRLSIDVLVEALTVDGFSLAGPDGGRVSGLLRRAWSDQNMDSLAAMAHTECLIGGLACLLVERSEQGRVLTRVLDAHTRVAWECDPSGRVVEAMIRTNGSDGTRWARVFGLDGCRWYRMSAGGRWVEEPSYRLSLPGVVPLIPMVNRVRPKDRRGRSEMDDVIPFADAASRSFTNLQVAQELLAMPQRYILGGATQVARRSDGTPVTQLEQYLGHYITGPADGKVGQLPGADLNAFISTIRMYAQMVSALAGIPPSMLGISTDNPASAEAMRAAKERLIARTERKQALFGDVWEQWARVVLAYAGMALEGLESLETTWRDPATPSQSAKNQMVLQAFQGGLVSGVTARELLPLTPEQRAREDANDNEEPTNGDV